MPGVWVRLRISPSFAGTVNRSPRATKSARAGRRERVALDVLLHVLEVRERVAEVAVDADGNALALLRRGVEAVDVAAVLVDHLRAIGAGPEHVVVVVR